MVHTAAAFAKAQQPAADARLHDLDRSRRHQHGHRRGRRHDQSPAGAAAAGRHLRHARVPRRCCSSWSRRLARTSSVNDCFKPVSRYLGSHQPARAARSLAARSHARADVAGRHRRRDAGAAAGRADRSVRLTRGAVRAAHLASCRGRAPTAICSTAPPSGSRRPGGRSSSPAAASSTARRATALRRFAEQTGIAVGETQAGKGSLPFDHPHSRSARSASPARSARTGCARDADLVLVVGSRLQRLHHRVEDRRSQNPDVRSSTSTSPSWTRTSTPRCRWWATPASRSGAGCSASAAYRVPAEYAARRRPRRRRGRLRSIACRRASRPRRPGQSRRVRRARSSAW